MINGIIWYISLFNNIYKFQMINEILNIILISNIIIITLRRPYFNFDTLITCSLYSIITAIQDNNLTFFHLINLIASINLVL